MIQEAFFYGLKMNSLFLYFVESYAISISAY